MPTFEMDFKFLKDDDGNINGLSLIARPHTESEVFCATFPGALCKGKADISVGENAIVFMHPTCGYPGDYNVEVNSQDLESFKNWMDALKQNGGKFKIVPDGFLTPGFRIVQATAEDLTKASTVAEEPAI